MEIFVGGAFLLLLMLGSCHGALHLQMVHRSSPISPHWKRSYDDPTHLLQELIRFDNLRMRMLGRILQEKQPQGSTARNPTLPDEDVLVSSKLISGSFIGSGQYFTMLKIGTPPKKFPLIVDTGSDLTWLRCNNYSDPAALNSSTPAPIYFTNTSSSFAPIPCTADECMFLPAPENSTCSAASPGTCDYTISYADQSTTTGILGYETFHMRLRKKKSQRIKHVRIENVALGCGLVNGGQSFNGASGVLGLGQGPVSFTTQVSKLLGGVFSYCLVNYLAPGGVNVSSELQFGRPKWVHRNLSYTPIVRNPTGGSFYYVNVLHVAVNGEVVKGSDESGSWRIDKDGNRGTIFDSGTTLSFFREPVYSRIMDALNRTIQLPRAENLKGFDLCYNVSGSEASGYSEQVPELEFVFEGGAVLRPPANNFLVLAAEDVKCVSFRPVRSDTGLNVIGNLLQQDFRVEYDLLRGRIGFKWSPCSGRRR